MNPISPAPAAPPVPGRASGSGRAAPGAGDGFADLINALLGPTGEPSRSGQRAGAPEGGAADERSPEPPVGDGSTSPVPGEGSAGEGPPAPVETAAKPVPAATVTPGTPVTPTPGPPSPTPPTSQEAADGAPGVAAPNAGVPSGPGLPASTTGAPAGATTGSGPTTGTVPVGGPVTTGMVTTAAAQQHPTQGNPDPSHSTTGHAAPVAAEAPTPVPPATQPTPSTPGQVSHPGTGDAPASVTTPTAPATPVAPADAAESRAVAHALAEIAREVANGGVTGVESPAGAGATTTGQAGAVAGATTAADGQLTHVGRQVSPTLVRFLESSAGGPTTHRVTLQLHPVDLGEVRATLTLRDGAVRVTLTAGEAARDLLRRDHPLLQQVLERTGAERVEVAVRALPGTALREGAESAFQLPTGTDTGSGRGPDNDQAGHREGHSGPPADRPGPSGRGATHGTGGADLPVPPERPTPRAGLDVTV